MTDIRQAPEYAVFLHSLHWKTEKHPSGSIAAIKPLLPLFGILKLQRVELAAIDFDWMQQLARRHLVFITYIELGDRLVLPVGTPFNPREVASFFAQATLVLEMHGYSPISHGMLPSKTQVINLTQSMEKILAGMKPKTRYNIGLAERKQVRLRIVSAPEFLADSVLFANVTSLLQQNAKRAGYWVEGKSWVQKKLQAFGSNAYITLAFNPKSPQEILAVALFLYTHDTCFYWVNGSTAHGRKVFAPSLCIFEALREAQRRKLTEFDFDGVYDERFPNKRWLGYTRFKQGFGGNYVFYPPCYIKRFACIR